MKKMIMTALIGLTAVCITWAQEAPKRKIKVSQVQFSGGGELTSAPLRLAEGDFAKLAPNAQINLTNQPNPIWMGESYTWMATALNMQVAGHPLKRGGEEENKNQTWRFGLSAQGIESNLFSNAETTRQRMDTLYMSSNQTVYGYVDSVSTTFVGGNYKSTALKLDGAFLWSTDAQRRFALYTGLGMNAGITLSPTTRVYNHHWTGKEVVGLDGVLLSSERYMNSQDGFSQTVYANKMGWVASVYIPCGAELRLGNKKEFWKNIRVFGEIRPSLNFIHVPETRTYVFPSIQNALGVKVSW
jgi:hypothetical protein